MLRLVALLIGLSFTGSVPALTTLLEVPLAINVKKRSAHIVRIKFDFRPSFTYLRDFDAISDFSIQTVLVRDEATGDLVSVFRQSDTNLVDHVLYLAPRYIAPDGKFRLVLSGSSSWLVPANESGKKIDIVSAEPVPDVHDFQTYRIAFGKPDDLPFIGANISYAEGTYRMLGTWFHNKFFRYGNDDASLRLPLVPGSNGYLTFNFYFSAATRVSLDDTGLAVLERSVGTRFFQDYYRVPYSKSNDGPSVLAMKNAAPFRAVPTNMRQMAFAFNSLDVTTTSQSGRRSVDVRNSLNRRLNGGGQSTSSLLQPASAIGALLTHQGGAWLPTRQERRERISRAVDAVVLLDPALNELVNVFHSTGDTWINSATGAAMMLDRLGYSVAYAYPEDIERIRPRIIYVPSQPFYSSILSSDAVRAMNGADRIIIEPSLSNQFIGNPAVEQGFGIKPLHSATFIRQDEIAYPDGPAVGAFYVTPIFDFQTQGTPYQQDATLIGAKLPTSYSRIEGGGRRTTFLTFPAGYIFYNYGLKSHQQVIEKITKDIEPRASASSKSQVRAYIVGETRCSIDIAVENNNFGSFNYYGFAKTTPVHPEAPPPAISEIRLGGSSIEGREWRVVGVPPLRSLVKDDGTVHLSGVQDDTTVSLLDRDCLESR